MTHVGAVAVEVPSRAFALTMMVPSLGVSGVLGAAPRAEGPSSRRLWISSRTHHHRRLIR